MFHLELEWEETERSVARSMREGDYATAQSELDSFLSQPHDPEARSSALGYRALFREESGNLEGAKRDLLEARAFSRPLSYPRIVNEESLAVVAEKQGLVEEALFWCRTALLTARDAQMPAGSALRRFLRLRGEGDLNSDERALCLAVAHQSWKKLQLPGEPNVTDLEQTAEELVKGESRSR